MKNNQVPPSVTCSPPILNIGPSLLAAYLFSVVGIAHSVAEPRGRDTSSSGRDEILLLTIPETRRVDDQRADAQGTEISAGEVRDVSTERVRVRNLVLYLHTPYGEKTVIERAAITATDPSDTPHRRELGRELQELKELQGVPFARDHFLRTERWLRDVNYDGHYDLVFSLPDTPTRLYLYSRSDGVYHIDDNTFESEPLLVFVGGSRY